MTEPTTQYQTFHGQSREDEIAWKIFQHEPAGYFVEVGAYDGVILSNTYAFERRGWRGMCFEPHPEFHKQLVANRPGSTCIHAAVGNQIELATPFFSTPNAIFSSTSQADLESLKSIYVDEREQFDQMQQITVPLITLDYALAIHGVEQVDYLSVDVEGRELDVLQGFEIVRWRVGRRGANLGCDLRLVFVRLLVVELGVFVGMRSYLRSWRRCGLLNDGHTSPTDNTTVCKFERNVAFVSAGHSVELLTDGERGGTGGDESVGHINLSVIRDTCDSERRSDSRYRV